MKIVVTGASGLLGWHAAVRIHARNCAARFQDSPEPFDLVALDRSGFGDRDRLSEALSGSNAVLHFAGVNRALDEEVEVANPGIAETLIQGCRDARATPHIVYANSVHALSEKTAYGRSKAEAGRMLEDYGGRFTNLVLPHIFGEGAKPHYNNVTATFIDLITRGESPTINPKGEVDLLHAGIAAEAAIESALQGRAGTVSPESLRMTVAQLFERIRQIHDAYQESEYPELDDPFDLSLFNSYRLALYPEGFPRALKINSDRRGTLFEAVKAGGQTFLSWTEPGMTRGDHFHLNKVERFLVLSGSARIRIRRVLGSSTWTYDVAGDLPAVVDMPTLHTHSIENIGDSSLLTLFWANEQFDPAAPDTYSDSVLGG